MTAWLSAAFVVIGSAFMLVAAIGVWRFPDVLTRIQAATKAGTLGIGCLMAAVAIHFAELAVTANAVLIVLFFFLTSPVAAHRIGRAAHRIGVPLWEGTHRDELRELPGFPSKMNRGMQHDATARSRAARRTTGGLRRPVRLRIGPMRKPDGRFERMGPLHLRLLDQTPRELGKGRRFTLSDQDGPLIARSSRDSSPWFSTRLTNSSRPTARRGSSRSARIWAPTSGGRRSATRS